MLGAYFERLSGRKTWEGEGKNDKAVAWALKMDKDLTEGDKWVWQEMFDARTKRRERRTDGRERIGRVWVNDDGERVQTREGKPE